MEEGRWKRDEGRWVAWALVFPRSRSICCVAWSTSRGVLSVRQQMAALRNRCSDWKPQGSVWMKDGLSHHPAHPFVYETDGLSELLFPVAQIATQAQIHFMHPVIRS